MNLAFISIPLVALVATQATYAFPGANIVLVIVIAVGLSAIPTALYGMLAATMPRSGGDYVFVSRILGPVIGFAASFNITLWFLLGAALLASYIAPLGFSFGLATIGVVMGAPGFVEASKTLTSPGWVFGSAATALILTTILVSIDLRVWTRLFNILFVLSLVGVVIAILLMFLSGRDNFVAALHGFGVSYGGVLSDARKAGYAGGEQLNLGNTLIASGIAFTAYGYGILTTYVGGEIRSPRKTFVRGLLTALAISGVLGVFLMAGAARTFGQDFLGSATYLSNVSPKDYPFSAPPFLPFFASMLSTSPILVGAIALSMALGIFVYLPPAILMVTRNLFSWSLDRVIPDKISEVNERFHSPIIANVVVLVICLAYLVLIVFGPSQFLTLLFTVIAGELLTFIVVAIAGAVFPWRRPHLYHESPIARNVFGVPLITVIGVLSILVYLLFLLPLLLNNQLGANNPIGLIGLVVIAVVPFPIYAISYSLNKRRGVDLSLAAAELPPE